MVEFIWCPSMCWSHVLPLMAYFSHYNGRFNGHVYLHQAQQVT
jgi:hypothetical protein